VTVPIPSAVGHSGGQAGQRGDHQRESAQVAAGVSVDPKIQTTVGYPAFFRRQSWHAADDGRIDVYASQVSFLAGRPLAGFTRTDRPGVDVGAA